MLCVLYQAKVGRMLQSLRHALQKVIHSAQTERNSSTAKPKPETGRIAYSCVIDHDPVLLAQCFIWVNCLMKIQTVPSRDIFIHVPDMPASELVSWLEALKVNLVAIKPFDERSPYCNKLCQLDTFQHREFDQVVLMDCDTAWVGDVPLPLGDPITAKIVDLTNPPEPLLSRIFHEAALGSPDWFEVSFPLGPERNRTDRNNCNGGLYILDGSVISRLNPVWCRWARWCLDRPELLGDYINHADQLSLALALRELGVSVRHLPVEWNYPTHLSPDLLPDIKPHNLHYHRNLTPNCKLALTGVREPDLAIEALNQHIDGFMASNFLNSVFWDFRYRIAPDLGSGVGSRAEMLEAKRKSLGYALAEFADRPVLDVGCGDLEVTRNLALTEYVGADVSQQALALAGAKRPDWTFIHLQDDAARWPGADAVICLDVLIHQQKATAFDALLQRLIDSASKRLIIGGYDQAPHLVSEIVSFHRPLTEALRSSGAFGEISTIGRYRDCSLVVADKQDPSVIRHPNDMKPDDFNYAATLTQRPDLLRHLADLSRGAFGFYTKQFTRALEYPWIADRLESLQPGQRVLDIGAGLNPLPFFLARRGCRVECVDPHPLERIPPAGPEWNEWGFFDYARRYPGIQSHHLDALAFQPTAGPLDAIYSVSVIEHMPRAQWENLLARCRDWLVTGGRLILTLDLIPGTDLLWNHSEGREVEPLEMHGNVPMFLTCLDRLGFRVLESVVERTVPRSRTGLLFVDCEVR